MMSVRTIDIFPHVHCDDRLLLAYPYMSTQPLLDYVLVYKNVPLDVIEAKAWVKPLKFGLAQAKN